jgi:hypothetical protein
MFMKAQLGVKEEPQISPYGFGSNDRVVRKGDGREDFISRSRKVKNFSFGVLNGETKGG